MWKLAAIIASVCLYATAAPAESCEERKAAFARVDKAQMIYTYGLTSAYDPIMRQVSECPMRKAWRGHVRKDGSRSRGGRVFRSRKEAEAHLKAKGWSDIRSVYGVLADWESDAYLYKPPDHYRLLNPAFVVPLDSR